LAFTAEALSLDEQAVIDTDIDEVVWLSSENIRQNNNQLRSELVIDCLDDYEQGKILSLDIFRKRL
jgi:hypothetical protein